MPTKKLASQTGNSCAAHCTAISIWEIKNTPLTKPFAEDTLWPSIQFVDQGGVSSALAATNNSDPRLIVSEVKKRWSGVTAKLLCDNAQKNAALAYVPPPTSLALDSLFSTLCGDAVTGPVLLDELVYYNCSYTMHNNTAPSKTNYTGLHNILVVLQGGKVHFYNPNENAPCWSTTGNWKILTGQNNATHSYVFAGVAVAIF